MRNRTSAYQNKVDNFYHIMNIGHAISRLLAAGIFTQFAALFLISIHYSLFAANGSGIPVFAIIGEVLEIISDSLFMLLLLLLAMGW